MSPTRSPSIALAAAIAAVLACACATLTPYQPARNGEGYSEQRLESNRYRVAFAGNSATSRQTVENYLLYRAAELTLDNGYDYFELSGGAIEREARSASGLSFGFGGFSFGSNAAFGVGVGTSTAEGPAYHDEADVVMFHGRKPDDDPVAFDAHEVKSNLESHIKRPKGETTS